MLAVLKWQTKVTAPKNKEQLLVTKCSAYLFGEVYRVCFANNKQKYYFEIPAMEYTTEELIELAEQTFSANRQTLDVAKCVRCSKWHVISGQFCERCKVAMETYDTTSAGVEELSVEL